MRTYPTLKFIHFEGLNNLWKQLFLFVPYSAKQITILMVAYLWQNQSKKYFKLIINFRILGKVLIFNKNSLNWIWNFWTFCIQQSFLIGRAIHDKVRLGERKNCNIFRILIFALIKTCARTFIRRNRFYNQKQLVQNRIYG